MLTGALFMLEVYDRILPSRSVPTLVALLFLVAGLYAAQGIIDTALSQTAMGRCAGNGGALP
jgi:ATP-binding cassette subfamily C protein